ncbi:hemolysin family protein [Nocardia bhagyanarayanae]|uniref:CBS domain containing-hemolysin-like protein n=1 Tax=Nocardia bhagyanarayanae TaxID=1215925 RepID=A0A543FI22_9NOCA|nr:hemolysin family protein [Nocardia bhagyanarayanae]TQM33426.1 CBS domain containing-hemolysin-like protein [Nocardia bhagyanarayanae]
MGDLFGVLLTVVLLAGNAFFVAAEFALISARRDRLEALAAQGKRNATTVIRAGENLSMMLAAAQLGITICSILLGRVGEPAVAHLLEGPFELLGLPDQLLHPVAFAIALTIVVILHILFGEMIPKNIALAGPERSALLLVPMHLVWLRVARPLIAIYNMAANLSLRLLRIEPKDELEATVSSVELAEMIGESRSEGLLDEEEHRRLTQALGTSDRIVADVLVPLAATRSIPLRGNGTTLGDIETAVAETGFSRYPVRASDGSLVGYLHVKDVLDKVADESAGPSTPIPRTDIRPLPTVGTGTTLFEALARLRRTSSHLGRVVDTRGNTVGIVALEDLVEEFVGTVRDTTHRITE